MITLSNFGGIVVFAGSIILVVGYVQTGNRLLSLPPSLRDLPAHMMVSPHAGYHPPTRYASTTHQPTSNERFCTVCGSKIALETQFCINCGTKLK
ncbi:MAG: zinc-ribbon domain-containing protein [Candidatus Kariarchaeaceae archaeon]